MPPSAPRTADPTAPVSASSPNRPAAATNEPDPAELLLRPGALLALDQGLRVGPSQLGVGLLLGRRCRTPDGQRGWLEVLDLLPGRVGITEVSVGIAFGVEFWSDVHARLDAEYPGRAVVGWFLVSPVQADDFPEASRRAHRKLFAEPHLVHIRFEPAVRRAKVFWYPGGADGGSEPMRREIELDSGPVNRSGAT